MPILSLEPSWNQAHRIGQIRREIANNVHNPHYTIWAQRVTPALSASRLVTAWGQLYGAHRVLSSQFDVEGATWFIPDSTPGHLSARHVSPQDFEDGLTHPFDYASEPASRLVLARDGDSTLVGIAVDHLISDGWTLAQLAKELVNAYQGKALPLENRFAEYVQKQNDHLRDPRTLARAEAIIDIMASTGGVLPPLNLSKPVPATDNEVRISYADRGFILEEHDWRTVRQSAPDLGMTPSNLILAALHLALARLTGTLRAGSTLTLANRHRPADRNAVGSYAAKMAINVSTAQAGSDNYGYLQAWQTSFWASLDTADIPWAYLLFRMHPEDFGAFTRRRYATYNFQPYLMNTRSGASWDDTHTMERIDIAAGRRDQALATFWFEGPSSVSCLWEYRTDSLDDETVSSLWSIFSTLLRELCGANRPDAPATSLRQQAPK